MKKNILILYTNYGTGHYMAAKAIEEYIENNFSTYNVEIFDPLSYSRPIINKIFAKFGKIMATKFRRIRGKFYKKNMYNNYLKVSLFSKVCINLFWTKKLQNRLVNFNPDIIISTQVGPTGLIAFNKHLFNAKLVSVFTDYGIHKMYTFPHKYVDIFCVPSQELKQQMINIGIKREKIKVTGIPVRSKFLIKNDCNVKEVINKYHLLKDKPIFLFICGGGLGYDNAFKYFEELLRLDYDFSYIFISGENQSLFNRAQKLTKRYKKTGKVFGYVKDIDKFIKCSDMVLGKPGGLITSETLNLGIPLCAIEPIPGQETNNALFVRDNNFGFYINNIKEFKLFLNKLKNNEINLEIYKKNIDNKFKSFSFLDVEKI